MALWNPIQSIVICGLIITPFSLSIPRIHGHVFTHLLISETITMRDWVIGIVDSKQRIKLCCCLYKIRDAY